MGRARGLRLLLDTPAVLWWVLGDERLSPRARDAIASADEALVSAVSAMEVATKFRIGKLPQAAPIAGDLHRCLPDHGFVPLALTLRHGDVAGMLRIPHNDPFDRLLIAQSQVEQVPLVSNETLFDDFGVRRLW